MRSTIFTVLVSCSLECCHSYASISVYVCVWCMTVCVCVCVCVWCMTVCVRVMHDCVCVCVQAACCFFVTFCSSTLRSCCHCKSLCALVDEYWLAGVLCAVRLVACSNCQHVIILIVIYYVVRLLMHHWLFFAHVMLMIVLLNKRWW